MWWWASPLNTRFTEYLPRTLISHLNIEQLFFSIFNLIAPPESSLPLYNALPFVSVSSDHWIFLTWPSTDMEATGPGLYGEQLEGAGWWFCYGFRSPKIHVTTWITAWVLVVFLSPIGWHQDFFLNLVWWWWGNSVLERIYWRLRCIRYSSILKNINQTGPCWTIRKKSLRWYVEFS